MIYLSWSVIHLTVVLLMWLVISGVLFYYSTGFRKKIVIASVFWLLVIFYMTFDVGTRQEHLQRSKFNATVPSEEIEKKSSQRTTANDVKQTFEQAVKETK